MKAAEVEQLIRRMQRIQDKIAQRAGPGCAWEYTFPDGETVRYRLLGVKDPEVAEDEIRELLTWVSNVKDWMKKRSETVGQSPRAIEKTVDDDRVLAICADLANSQKHGGLDPKKHKPRSGEDPVLAPVKYSASSANAGIRSISYGAEGVVTEFDPEKTEITMEVRNGSGVVIGDALDFLNHAVARWEEVFVRLK